MKKLTFFVLLLIALPYFTSAQYNLSGIVKDKSSGEILTGAGIHLENTYLSTTTQKDGTFAFSGLKSGKYTLRVSFIGYTVYKSEINLDTDTRLEIDLVRSVVMQDEVIISTTRPGDKTPGTYITIDKAEINRYNLGCTFRTNQWLPVVLPGAYHNSLSYW